jgi:hypothetical protein
MFSNLLNIELIIKNAGQPTSALEFETWCSILATDSRVSNYVLHVTSRISMVSGNCARQGSATTAFLGPLLQPDDVDLVADMTLVTTIVWTV